jgi:nucleoside 2-deoxyribosyltransferase
MKKNKVYISGRISGMLFTDAYQKFQLAEQKLSELGYEVVNPMTIEHDHDKTWEAYMKNDIKAMCDCDTIFMLDNWRESRGATIELNLAIQLGLSVLHETSFQHS